VGGDERELVGRKAGEHGVELVGERVAISAPHVVLDGGVGHQRREDVGGPGCVLGVEPAGDPKLAMVTSSGTASPGPELVFGVFFWYLLVTVVPFLVVSWRMPNTYPTGGVKRGTATPKFHETRDNLPLVPNR